MLEVIIIVILIVIIWLIIDSLYRGAYTKGYEDADKGKEQAYYHEM